MCQHAWRQLLQTPGLAMTCMLASSQMQHHLTMHTPLAMACLLSSRGSDRITADIAGQSMQLELTLQRDDDPTSLA